MARHAAPLKETDLARTGTTVGDVPVLVIGARSAERRGLVILLPPLGGTKDQFEPELRRLAAAGLIGVAIDPRRHGERADRPAGALFDEVMAHFRQVMWPLLGGTVLDAMAVIDWVAARFEVPGPVLAGGVSMGGDAALALAGIDPRVSRVAAIAATADWTRPGMTRIGRPQETIDQGAATPSGQWLRDQLEPMSHPDRYRRHLEIRCDVGGTDSHVPPEAMGRFARLLADGSPRPSIQVIEHPGLDHAEICSSPQILDESLDWLAAGSDSGSD